MRVLIQGAGIGGLTLAHMLQKQNINFKIYEKREEVSGGGAGITLSSNALGHLAQAMDIEGLLKSSQQLHQLHILNSQGQVLSSIPSRLNNQAQPGIGVLRASLHHELLKGLPTEKIYLGTSVETVSFEENKIHVIPSKNEKEQFDFVIGADGLYSKLRTYVEPAAQAQYCGYTCWRGVVSHILQAPEHAGEMWGRGRRLGYVQVSPDKVYFYMTLNGPPDSTGKRSLSLDKLKDHFADFKGEAPALLSKLTNSADLIHKDLEEIRLQKWFSGRILLLGDAAHGMTPNLGQGAAMAIEDAISLGKIWQVDRSVQSLERFQKIRRPRVDWVQDQSRQVGAVGQLESPAGRWFRDQVLKHTPARIAHKNLEKLLAFQV